MNRPGKTVWVSANNHELVVFCLTVFIVRLLRGRAVVSRTCNRLAVSRLASANQTGAVSSALRTAQLYDVEWALSPVPVKNHPYLSTICLSIWCIFILLRLWWDFIILEFLFQFSSERLPTRRSNRGGQGQSALWTCKGKAALLGHSSKCHTKTGRYPFLNNFVSFSCTDGGRNSDFATGCFGQRAICSRYSQAAWYESSQ